MTTGEVKYDLQGRLYPEQCRGDLSWVNAKIEYRPLKEMPEARGYPGEKTTGGVYLNRTPPLIILANEILRLNEPHILLAVRLKRTND